MNKKQLQHQFVDYLVQNYSYARPEIMASNVFYSYNHDIGINFFDIFLSEESLLQGKVLIQKKFEETGRKDPKGHANVHYGCFIKFKEFLDYTYGNSHNAKLQFHE